MKLRVKTDAKQFDESKADKEKQADDDVMDDSQQVELQDSPLQQVC